MKYIAFVFLLLLQTLIADNAAPSISVPNSISPCSPVPLEINGGTPPYSVSILKADNPSGPALQEFTDVRQPSNLSWGTNLAAGSVITFNVKDAKGATANSGQSSVSGNCAQNQTTFNPSLTTNKFDDSISPPATNSTASNNTGNVAPNPIPPTDGSIANSSIPVNGTQAPATPVTPTNGPDNSTDVNMGSLLPSNPNGTNTPIPSSVANVTTPPNSSKNTTQSRGSSVNVNNPKNNQTAKPSSSNGASFKFPLSAVESMRSSLFMPLIVILATLT